ncbi:OmpA family protein [Polycyclovorans algicola]|uniref:OmpA family protein n=1 Tax=Polycyclovorans algicola TaxID=616992 RepID=UPI000693265E|nr:OmpA family protein [Polycyclovorans algicola]
MTLIRILKTSRLRQHDATPRFDKDHTMKLASRFGALTVALLAGSLITAAHAEESNSPLRQGAYVSPMVSGFLTDDDDGLDDGIGGTLALGYRSSFYAFELAGIGADVGTATIEGIALNTLLFPFSGLPNLYFTAGISGFNYKDYETPSGDLKDFNSNNVDGGVGYIFPLSWGRYDYGIRSEVRYRAGRRERDFNDLDIDIDAPRSPNHIALNLGLQLPTRLAPAPVPEPTEDPTSVVPPTEPVDSDGDGVDDGRDQCPNTPRGESVDSVGCPLPPPPPDCGEVVNGGVPSIEGCSEGDSIVLRGVYFETNLARLDANAKTLLDDVVADLEKFPDIDVEVGGHTDSRGAADYNQGLSERRANSVLDYLVSNGIDGDRLTAKGYGLTAPVADNDTAEGQDRNRRVELKITRGEAVRRASDEGSSSPSPTPSAVDEDAGADVDANTDEQNPVSTPEPTAAPSADDQDTDEALDDLFDF